VLQTHAAGKREESSPTRGADGDCLQESPELGEILQVQASRIIAQVQIEGQNFSATIDTGASRSFVSERVVQLVGTAHNVRSVRTHVSLAEGSRKEITTSLVAKVQLDQRRVTFPLLVLPSIMEDVLLGMDFLCGVSATIQCGRASLQLSPFLLTSPTYNLATPSVLTNAFFKRSLVYLGHVISEEGIHTDPEKISAVRQLSPPTTCKELRRCLGIASWYRRFVPNFASVVQPMSLLLKKGKKWQWEKEQQDAFDDLKSKLTEAPVLACPDFNEKFVLQTDASDIGLGAVLTQTIQGEERVIAFASRRLIAAEENYSATEKECLAIIWAIRKLRCYLEGYRFEVITDHLALKWLNSIENPTGRVARWALELQQYQFDVTYRRGSQNVVADALSRQPLEVLQMIQEDKPESTWYQRMVKLVQDRPEDYPDYVYENQQLYRHIASRPDDEDSVPWKLCVAKEHRQRVLAECHDQPTAGHLGIRKTTARIAQRYYWPGLFRDISRYVRKCDTCQRFKVSQAKPAGKMFTRQVSEPFDTVCADFIGPLPRSK
ncbi:hypothetical protein KR059_001065, partial [Drosophila kikkawai]